MEGVTVVQHPLVQHKLTLLRESSRSTKSFRELCRELGILMCYEVTCDLPLDLVEIETPMARMMAPTIAGKKLVFVPILRAGMALAEGMLELVPSARVAHIGLYRDPDTLVAVRYFFKAPGDVSEAADGAQPRAQLSAVVIGVSVSIWPAIVADQKGLFMEEGLDFDLINSGSSARSLQQVAAGSAPIGSSSMVDSIRAIGGGANVKIFLNSLAVGTHSLVAAKNIKSVRDLKGKRVMTGGQGDITNLWWYAVAKHFGLAPSRDVELLFSGSTTARTAALLGGAIDASVLSTPQSFKAIEDGFTDLGPVAPYLGEFPMMIWHVNANWARANEKTLAAFVRAHNKAVRYMSDPAHK